MCDVTHPVFDFVCFVWFGHDIFSLRVDVISHPIVISIISIIMLVHYALTLHQLSLV
jgi:hypothetical protein